MNNGQGLVAGDPVVEKAGSLVRTRSKFGLGYNFFTTHRFGEISPFFWMENVDGDKQNHLNSSSKVDSYTLKSPLMQDIKMKKDLFYVPRQALLPLNWDKFYTNPNIGDDVPDDVGTGVLSFWFELGRLCNPSEFFANPPANPTVNDFLRVWEWFIFFEMFYSDGSLLANLGIHGSKFHRFNHNQFGFDRVSFDTVFDHYMKPSAFLENAAVAHGFAVVKNSGQVNEQRFYVSDNYEFRGEVDMYQCKVITWREFLDLLRDDLTGWSAFTDIAPYGLDYSINYDGLFELNSVDFALQSSLAINGDDLDIARPLAYQMVCHHFYSNDHVDYLYSAELFRQYIGSLVGLANDNHFHTFTWNGIEYQYDYLSAHYMNQFISGGYSQADNSFISYFQSIFSFRHSLRFVDYFTGARTRPLAVGDTNVDVNNNVASVIDITRNIQKQRFLNALNRIGRKIADYSKLMGGDGMRPDFHDPLYIGHTADTIYGERSEYTGNVENAQQNNITSLLKNAGARYGFTWDVDRPGIVIGVCYFDIARVYTESIERQAFHMNRFDMFNPYMQFIGDQKIYKSELLTGGQVPFGYANRHIEYKTRFDQAAGGFVSDSGLPEWIFAAERGYRKYENNISPTFIRSSNSEFDRFYVSLTGYSLGTYFHFIARHFNDCSSSRPMVVAPDILQ